MGNRDKLHTGELYLPNDPEVMEEQLDYMELLYEYNQTRPREQERRQRRPHTSSQDFMQQLRLGLIPADGEF